MIRHNEISHKPVSFILSFVGLVSLRRISNLKSFKVKFFFFFFFCEQKSCRVLESFGFVFLNKKVVRLLVFFLFLFLYNKDN